MLRTARCFMQRRSRQSLRRVRLCSMTWGMLVEAPVLVGSAFATRDAGSRHARAAAMSSLPAPQPVDGPGPAARAVPRRQLESARE